MIDVAATLNLQISIAKTHFVPVSLAWLQPVLFEFGGREIQKQPPFRFREQVRVVSKANRMQEDAGGSSQILYSSNAQLYYD